MIPPTERQGELLETQYVPSQEKGNLLEPQFVPTTRTVVSEKPTEETTQKPQLERPSDYQLRVELEQAILNDLLGPAGGEEEELDEDNVRDRYLIGLLAPQQRYITPEQQDELAVAGKGTVEEGSTEVSTVSTETMFPSSFGMTFVSVPVLRICR